MLRLDADLDRVLALEGVVRVNLYLRAGLGLLQGELLQAHPQLGLELEVRSPPAALGLDLELALPGLVELDQGLAVGDAFLEVDDGDLGVQPCLQDLVAGLQRVFRLEGQSPGLGGEDAAVRGESEADLIPFLRLHEADNLLEVTAARRRLADGDAVFLDLQDEVADDVGAGLELDAQVLQGDRLAFDHAVVVDLELGLLGLSLRAGLELGLAQVQAVRVFNLCPQAEGNPDRHLQCPDQIIVGERDQEAGLERLPLLDGLAFLGDEGLDVQVPFLFRLEDQAFILGQEVVDLVPIQQPFEVAAHLDLLDLEGEVGRVLGLQDLFVRPLCLGVQGQAQLSGGEFQHFLFDRQVDEL